MTPNIEQVINAFLSKITDYDILEYDEDDRNSIIESYLQPALARFSRYSDKTFTNDMGFEEIKTDVFLTSEEIGIVSDLMLAQWIKPYILNAENLRLQFNTKDFTKTSPANLLKELRETYDTLISESERKLTEFAYLERLAR